MMKFLVFTLFVAGGKDLSHKTLIQPSVSSHVHIQYFSFLYKQFVLTIVHLLTILKESVSVCPFSLRVRPANLPPCGDQGGWRRGCEASQLALAGKTC